MDKPSKAYSIILYLIWPLSSLIVGVKNFDSVFGRNLLVATFVFLGFSSTESGDLEAYSLRYYELLNHNFSEIFNLFINFQLNRFFTDISAILFSPFENHNIYFAFLFGVFGFLLINTINLLRLTLLKRSSFLHIIVFITFASFYSVLAIHNYAFYTGGIYFLYFLLKYIFYRRQNKYFILIFLTPIFHLGLTPLLLLPILYIVFKKNTNWYILLLVFSVFVSQGSITSFIEQSLVQEDTVIENRFNAYASESGLERMENRYSDDYKTGNINYRILIDSRKLSHQFAIPLLLLILFLNVRNIKDDIILRDLLNLSIGAFSITQIMLNISQGERFYLINGFLTLCLLVYYIQRYRFADFKYKGILLIVIPTILTYNLVSLVVSKSLISDDFIFSNFPIMFYRLLN